MLQKSFLHVAGILLLMLGSAASIWAGSDIIGEISYLEGSVDVYRSAAESLEPDFGMRLENMDQIITGPDGLVELALYPETGIHASIIIQPNTVMYLDLSSLTSEQTGVIELVTGQVKLTVARLSGHNRLDVRTSNATLGVRGTVFTVDSTIAGDLLLSTTEGRVECVTFGGQTLFSVPGEAVEGLAEGDWRNVRFSVDEVDDFRSNWFSARLEALDADPQRALAAYVLRYQRLRTDFLESYVRLMNHREILEKWMDEDRLGRVGSTADRLREKRQIISALMAIRSSLFMFERVYFRIEQLLENYPDIPADTRLYPGMIYSDFLREFQADRLIFPRRMQEIRYILKLYALRNDGVSPFAAFEDMNEEDGFFQTGQGFWGD